MLQMGGPAALCTVAEFSNNHGSEATPCAESFDTVFSTLYQEAEISSANQVEAGHVPPLVKPQYLEVFELTKLSFQICLDINRKRLYL